MISKSEALAKVLKISLVQATVIRMTIDCETFPSVVVCYYLSFNPKHAWTIKQAISCEKGLSLLALESSSKKCNAQIES